MAEVRTGADHVLRMAMQNANDAEVQRQGNIVHEYLRAFQNPDARAAHPEGKVGDLGQLARNKARAESRRGFAGEILCEARLNEQAIQRGNAHRARRTNNNDPLVDVSIVDGHGRAIPQEGIQVKFEGRDPKEQLKSLHGRKHRKYLDNNVPLAIADDYYDVLMGDGPDSINTQIAGLQDKLQCAKKAGDSKKAQQLQEQINRNKQIKRQLRKAGCTMKEAERSRLTALKSLGANAHKAAAGAAVNAAVGAGIASLIANLVACICGEKEPAQAAKDAGKSTGMAAALAYATTGVATLITGMLLNSKNEYTKALGAADAVPAMVSGTADTIMLVSRLTQGDITQEEFIDSLADRHIGGLGSCYGALIANLGMRMLTTNQLMNAMAGTIGGVLGYQLAMAAYTILKESAQDYKKAKEERIRIEQECAEVVNLVTQYRRQLNEDVAQYMGEHLSVFNDAMLAMDAALVVNDVNGFLAANADIQAILQHDVQFRTQEEFDDLMASDEPLVL